MRKSSKIWSCLFGLTIGARSWLSKAPYIFEKRFNCSYRQMCKFLMTFGDKLTEVKFQKLDLGLPVKKVGPRGLICLNGDKYSIYDLSKSTITPLTVNIEDCAHIISKYAVTFDYQINTLSMKIYSLEEDRLLQSYDNIMNMQTAHGSVDRWEIKRKFRFMIIVW